MLQGSFHNCALTTRNYPPTVSASRSDTARAAWLRLGRQPRPPRGGFLGRALCAVHPSFGLHRSCCSTPSLLVFLLAFAPNPLPSKRQQVEARFQQRWLKIFRSTPWHHSSRCRRVGN